MRAVTAEEAGIPTSQAEPVTRVAQAVFRVAGEAAEVLAKLREAVEQEAQAARAA